MLRITFFFVFIFMVNGCSPDHSTPTQGSFGQHQASPYGTRTSSSQNMMGNNTKTPQQNKTLALLLPLSGRYKTVGQDLLNAAQLALFDMNDPSITLIPIDTKGTVNGAKDAAIKAARNNAQLIIGPLLADSVRKAGGVAYRYNTPVIGFTTDSRVAGGNVFTMGILPGDQGVRLANYAAQSNLKRIVIINPQTDYAKAVLKSFNNAARNLDLEIIQTITISPSDNMEFVAHRLSVAKGQFDAIFMPLADPQLSDLSQRLVEQEMGANIMPWLGTGLWDEPTITKNDYMRGAIFSAPSSSLRQNYETQYSASFNKPATRLSSLAYDATALGVILLNQTPEKQSVSKRIILNANGFSGIDGIFRFKQSGQAERGLAIQKIIGREQISVIAPAPNSFAQ